VRYAQNLQKIILHYSIGTSKAVHEKSSNKLFIFVRVEYSVYNDGCR